ncbi:MAG: hypothetical protein L6R39_002070 [Caloplaca ligustica]|nr:MAG: hypothetical protein L6R39_002070 [Caloplaca ligustica]
MPTTSPTAPSEPVVIPTRTATGRRQGKTYPRAERAAGGCGTPHDPKALPPSVAAFRAISTPSNRKRIPVLGLGTERARFIEEELGDASDNELSGTASSLSSPHSWRLLLSPPEDINDDEGLDFGDEDTVFGSFPPLRSLSNDSMPSLDTDNESAYTSSSPSTPGLPIRRRCTHERRSKTISSSVPEDSRSNHPLLTICTSDEHASSTASEDDEAEEPKFSASTRQSLTSNLTASLRRLKSAARSLSNPNAPAISPAEKQGRATIAQSSQIVRERRPLPWSEPPDPALRRYLNPITLSPAELYTHRGHDDGKASRNGCIASIQMQTYRPGARKSEKASAPPTFVLASSHGSPLDESAVCAAPRQREPRESSDFLRVIVLEMNMRKAGKLSDAAPGRAKLWLPARQVAAQNEDAGSDTPRRWVSISP